MSSDSKDRVDLSAVLFILFLHHIHGTLYARGKFLSARIALLIAWASDFQFDIVLSGIDQFVNLFFIFLREKWYKSRKPYVGNFLFEMLQLHSENPLCKYAPIRFPYTSHCWNCTPWSNRASSTSWSSRSFLVRSILLSLWKPIPIYTWTHIESPFVLTDTWNIEKTNSLSDEMENLRIRNWRSSRNERQSFASIFQMGGVTKKNLSNRLSRRESISGIISTAKLTLIS